MDEKQTGRGKQRKYSADKLLALPGVREAIDLVEQRAWVRAVDEAINEGAEGGLGDQACQLISESGTEDLGKFPTITVEALTKAGSLNNFQDAVLALCQQIES